jgi:hypothetical protein
LNLRPALFLCRSHNAGVEGSSPSLSSRNYKALRAISWRRADGALACKSTASPPGVISAVERIAAGRAGWHGRVGAGLWGRDQTHAPRRTASRTRQSPPVGRSRITSTRARARVRFRACEMDQCPRLARAPHGFRPQGKIYGTRRASGGGDSAQSVRDSRYQIWPALHGRTQPR